MTLCVLFVLVRFPKLSETFVLAEMLSLEEAGWRVGVDVLESPLDEPRDPALARLRARVRRLPDRPSRRRLLATHATLAVRRPLAWCRAARRARSEGRWPDFLRAGLVAARAVRERTDLLHVHFAYYSAEYARDAAALAGIPFTVMAHGNDIFGSFNEPHLVRRLSAATGVATATRYNADAIRERVPGVDVRCLWQVVPLPERLEVAHDGPLLAVARLVPKKGIDTLVEAIALAAREAPELRAEVIGEGPQLGELQKLAAERGVTGRITFRGACEPPEVAEAYRRCSALVAPCRIAPDGDRDGLPTVLLEAMGRGLPVVTTHVIGIPELVRHEENGMLVPPDDPAALAEALLRIRREDGLAERIAQGARRTIAEERSLERSSEAMRAWLADCAARG
jgi:glycosyltransferase involved in cell wall biosynthesis